MGGLLSHDDVAPTFFNYLPCKDVLTLRQSCYYWRDLPFNHVVLRCLRPAIHFSPDEELKLFKLFYRYTTANPAALSNALSLLESDPSFEKAQKDGKTVVINSWNKYCGTCIRQEKVFKEAIFILSKRYSNGIRSISTAVLQPIKPV